MLSAVFLPVLAVVIVLCFLSGLSNVSRGHAQEELQQLEEALRRSAVACYAAEGMYPPNVAYLVEHYGIQINEKQFTVRYIPIADNLMPDITVLEK